MPFFMGQKQPEPRETNDWLILPLLCGKVFLVRSQEHNVDHLWKGKALQKVM